MKTSLIGQLFLSIAPIVLGMLLLTGAIAFISAREEIEAVSDQQMANDASVLWSLVQDELDESEKNNELLNVEFGENGDLREEDGDSAKNLGDARMFRIWEGPRIIMKSDTALPPSTPRQSEGFHNLRVDGEPWRVYTIAAGRRDIVLEVGEKQSLRDGLIYSILFDFIVPLLFGLPLLVGTLWLGIRRGIRPLQDLVGQIRQRNPEELEAIDASNQPRDLEPLVDSINRLLRKLKQSLSAERRFADHAAHQLRTPLSSSRLLIQMLHEADSEQERQILLQHLAASNQQSSALVQKLLMLARLSYQPLHPLPVNLAATLRAVLQQLALPIESKHLRVRIEVGDDLVLKTDETLLSLMLHNVIENAVKYSPEGGGIAIRATTDGQQLLLTVRDAGPGIALPERQAVFQRFYRVNESGEGTGLGLAIVAEAAVRLKAEVRLESAPGDSGLDVMLRLPIG